MSARDPPNLRRWVEWGVKKAGEDNSYGYTYTMHKGILKYTRNTLDCDQSNYSSRIVFSQIPVEFGQTGISAIRSADPENPILQPNTE